MDDLIEIIVADVRPEASCTPTAYPNCRAPHSTVDQAFA